MNHSDSMLTISITLPDLARLRRLGRLRRRLEMQGFCGVADAQLRTVDLAARLAPALCMAWCAVATATGSAMAFWALVPFAALGAVLQRHPFDLLYQWGLRPLLGSAELPCHRAPRRFACAVAAVWLVAAALCLEAGAETLGRTLGLLLVAVAAVPVTSGFCVPSWVFRRALGRRRRRSGGVTGSL